MRISIVLLMACVTLCAAAPVCAVQALTNGNFESGAAGGVPNGWTLAASTVYAYDSYAANWQLFSNTLNNYPPLDAYDGGWSLGAYRVDGGQRNTARPGLEFYEFNVLYQNIPVNPNTTYYVKVSAAVFVHHDRMGDIEDFWGAGIALRICPGSGQYSRSAAVWDHGFWNWEGDSFWRHYPTLTNQITHNAPNRFTTGPSQTSVTFSIIWYTKWNADIDLCAIDNVELHLSTSGPEPVGSDAYSVKQPANWGSGDQIWAPTDALVDWSKAGATSGGDQFYQSMELTTGMRPIGAAVGDFNSDGLPDIAVVSNWSHLVSVFIQKPDGGFQPPVHITGAVMPRCVQAAQVVGSPALDLVVSCAGTGQVAVFPGAGDGTFGAPYLTSVELQPTWLAVADFNGDSKADFAVGEQRAGASGQVGVYLGNGAGGFSRAQTITGIEVPSFIIAEDFGGGAPAYMPDGIPDLAILSWNGPVVIYRGSGNGTFIYADTISNHSQWKSTGMAAANFDGDPDGIPDLCAAYMWEADYAQLASGYGDCTFDGQLSLEDWIRPGRFPSGVGALDYDSDGLIDIAFSMIESHNLQVFRNLGFDGAFNFQSRGHFGVGRANTSLLTADINLDGYDDMLITSGATQTANVVYGGPIGVVCAPNSMHNTGVNCAAIADFVTATPRPDIAVATDTVRLFRNYGSMNLVEVFSAPIYSQCVDLGAADLNADGHMDMVAIGVTTTGQASAYVFLGNGAGGFSGSAFPYSVSGGKQAQDLVITDVDNAKGPDLIATEAQQFYEGVYCRLNDGSGGFGGAMDRKKSALPTGSLPRDLDASDFNSDGKPDVVVAMAGRGQFALMTGRGDGFFNAPVYFNTGAEPTGICAGDFDSDGKLDVAVTNRADGTLMVFAGSGGGSFALASVIPVGPAPASVERFDFNVDSVPDLVIAHPGERTFSLLRGRGDGTFDPVQSYRTAEPVRRFAAGDLRGTGLNDLVAGGNLQVFRNSLLSTSQVTVTDEGAAQSATDSMSGEWYAPGTGGRTIVRYRWAVSTSPNTSGIIPGGGWLYTTDTAGTRSVTLDVGQTYYILAQAEDSMNLWTAVGASDGILIAAPVRVSTPAEAKLLADGQPLVLSGAVVSRVWGGGDWVCYVQDADRASGIRVEGSGPAPTAGTQVEIAGAMGSFGFERTVVATSVTSTGAPGEPRPLAVVGRTLLANGVDHVGLLIRLAGRVTGHAAAEGCFYVDDGSGEVRCAAAGLSWPSVGSFVTVTGASGVDDVSGAPTACVRVQRGSDILGVQ